MRLRDFGAGVVFASINVLAALGAIPNRQPLQGVLEIRGFTIVDPPPHEPRDTHAAYSRDYTNQIIQIFRSDPRVGAIYFNDTRIPGTTWWRGHDNHFHVRVLP
jgi:hypothetical protein